MNQLAKAIDDLLDSYLFCVSSDLGIIWSFVDSAEDLKGVLVWRSSGLKSVFWYHQGYAYEMMLNILPKSNALNSN